MSAFPILLAIASLGPSVPSPTASQLSIILQPFNFLASFLESTRISYDLLASLLIVPTYLTFARRSATAGAGAPSRWPANLSTILVLLNTYASIRVLLHPPENIFSAIPFAASPSDLLAILPPRAVSDANANQQFDELIKRMANVDIRKEYIRYGHDTMMNTPSLGSSTLIFTTFIALQLPSYVLTAFVLAIMVSLPSSPSLSHSSPSPPPSSNASGAPNPPPKRTLLTVLTSSLISSTTLKAWLMIVLLAIFGTELYWTSSTRFEAASPSSFFGNRGRGRMEIQPPIYEIARTVRMVMLLVLPVGVRWVLFGPFIPGRSASGHSEGNRQSQSQPTSKAGMIQSIAHSLNEAVRRLHHTQNLQRVALTDPKVAAKWNESARRAHQTQSTLLSSPTLQASAAAHELAYGNSISSSSDNPNGAGDGAGGGGGGGAFKLKVGETVKGIMDDLRRLLWQVVNSRTGSGSGPGES